MKRWMITSALGLLVLSTTACEDLLFDDAEHIYNGPPTVEFAPVLPAGNYARTITFTAGSATNQTTNLRVNWITAAPSADMSGDITRVSTSTAVEGTHYRFPAGARYTIRAGTNFVDLPVEVLAAGLAAGTTVTLTLELAAGTGFQVSTKYKTFTLTLRRT